MTDTNPTDERWERHVSRRCPRMDREHRYGNDGGKPRPIPCPDCYSIESYWRRIPYEPDGTTVLDGPVVVLHPGQHVVEGGTVIEFLDGKCVLGDHNDWITLIASGSPIPTPPIQPPGGG